MPQVSSTHCSVDIVTPEGIRLVFLPDQAVPDLLQVETHNDMAEACGSFTLTFTPRRIEGRTYDQLIPLRSLVTIRFQDRDQPVSDADAVVMLGLTEDHSVSEDWSRAQPQRVVRIQGRSIAAILLDAHLFYHPLLEKEGATLSDVEGRPNLFWMTQLLTANVDPRIAIAKVLRYFLGQLTPPPTPAPSAPSAPSATGATRSMGPQEKILTQEEVITMMLAQNPGMTREQAEARLAQSATPQHQATLAKRQRPPQGGQVNALRFSRLVTLYMQRHPGVSRADATTAVQEALTAKGGPGTGAAPQETPAPAPVTPPPAAPAPVQTEPTGGRQIINLQLPQVELPDLLHLNDATWTLFEPGVTFTMATNPPMVGSVWNYVQMFVDSLFQEFFTRIEDGVCKIVFRGKPFVPEDLREGTRFQTDVPTCDTLFLDQAAILHSAVRRQSSNVYNTFMVLPMFVSTLLKQPGAKYLIKPVQLNDPNHPSYVGKYGIRILEHLTPYIPALGPAEVAASEGKGTLDSWGALAERWEAMVAAWYGYGPELYAGTLTVQGSPRWNCGHRLLTLEERGQREWYCEGVGHHYDYHTGQYISQLRVTRGWYLEGLVDVREAPRQGVGDVEVQFVDYDL